MYYPAMGGDMKLTFGKTIYERTEHGWQWTVQYEGSPTPPSVPVSVNTPPLLDEVVRLRETISKIPRCRYCGVYVQLGGPGGGCCLDCSYYHGDTRQVSDNLIRA